MLNPNLVVSTISHKIKLCISYNFNPDGINIILTADEAVITVIMTSSGPFKNIYMR
jgi:hypothetical protein